MIFMFVCFPLFNNNDNRWKIGDQNDEWRILTFQFCIFFPLSRTHTTIQKRISRRRKIESYRNSLDMNVMMMMITITKQEKKLKHLQIKWKKMVNISVSTVKPSLMDGFFFLFCFGCLLFDTKKPRRKRQPNGIFFLVFLFPL